MPELQNRPREIEDGSLSQQHDCIQSYGLLLVLSEPDLIIRQVSQNCAGIIGKTAASLLGKPIEAALGRNQRTALENTTRATRGHLPEHSLSFNLTIQGQRKQFNAFVHRRDNQLLLELEPARTLADTELARVLNQASAALAAIECEFQLERLTDLAVRVMRDILRYDRVVLYRIDEGGNGTVIAEDRADQTALPSLLGLNAAGDSSIPQRMLSERRRHLREVRDLRSRTSTLMPLLNPVTGTRLSLKHTFLRCPSASPWKQQLAAQGVRGKMRVSISVDGGLWGLIIGHQERPRSLARELRRIAIDLAHALSLQISLVQKRAASERHARHHIARQALLAALNPGLVPSASNAIALPRAMEQFQAALLEAPDAQGAALWWAGQLSLYGRTPGALRVAALARWLSTERPYAIAGESHLLCYASRSLQSDHPDIAEFHSIAGVLAIPLGEEDCLIWFRDAQTGQKAQRPRAEVWSAADIAAAQGYIQLGWMARRENRHRAAPDADDGRLHSVIENLAHGVIIFSAQGEPLFANSAAARIYDLDTQALLHTLATSSAAHLRADGSELPAEQTPMRLAMASGEAVNDYRMGIRLPDGSVRWTTTSCRPVAGADSSGQIRLVMSLHDVSEQQRIERDLQLLAHFDTLTGLPNRALLKERLDQAMTRAGAEESGTTHVGIVIVGLDRFKEINDTLGTAAGDQVLQEVARRLNQLLGDTHTVARFGGDEFAVLAQGTSRDEIIQTAALSRQALDASAHIDGHEIFIGGSVGGSVFPDDGESRDELLKNADIAMNEAKAEGGNGLRMFSPELQARSGHELSLAAKLRRALERGELGIAYQPQVNMVTGRVLGLEALMRWNSPELGMVAPAQFIRIAEETGLILPMGEWLLQSICEQNRAWQLAGLPPLTVAVNLSARQFRDRQLGQKVSTALSATGMDARWLEFEITESVIMQDTQHNTETLEQLVSLGAKVAVDDFGTGYSSLAYLKRFPVHVLKIDRTFVRDISTDRDDAAIVRTIVALAHSLELGVIAEGVETADQLRFLAQLNCDLYQGYYFSKPVSPEEIVKLLKP